VKKIPKKLYHAAPECATFNISEEGLRSNLGEIYASGSIAGALTFMWFRLLDHAHISRENGQTKMEVVAHDSIYVWEIDTSKTDATLWEEGTDHSASFFGNATSFVYLSKEIPPSALSCFVFPREQIEEAVQQSREESESV